jgi:cell division protein FtsB
MNKRVLKIIFLVFSLTLLVRMSQSTYEIWKKRDIVAVRKSELSAVEEENRKLKRELENVQSDEFVEKQARNTLGLVKPGEIVVLLTTPVPTPGIKPPLQTGSTAKNGPVWRQWLSLFY